MATLSPSAHPAAKPAPWTPIFREQVGKMASPEFVLATLEPLPAGSSLAAVPRARYCIYRGLWANLEPNDKNPATLNPPVWASDCPTFTTDIRMEKARQLAATSNIPQTGFGGQHNRSGSGNEPGDESGGGGPVEAVWWIKEDNIMAQWRVRGTAWVLGRDADSSSVAAQRARAAIQRRMREGTEPARKDEWSWEREVTTHFGNVSPAMRGTFRHPPPGVPTHGKEADPENKLGQKIEDLDDPIARQNFRVVVILPDEVEHVKLADPERAHRMVYTFTPETGEWSEEERWP